MATASISQVKVGNTTYDVNDAIVRDYLSIDNLFLSVNCSATETLSEAGEAGSGKIINWNKDKGSDILSNYSFLSYQRIYSQSTDVVIFYFSETQVGLRNVASTNARTVTTDGIQLYIKKF